jgi:hypothetical protein
MSVYRSFVRRLRGVEADQIGQPDYLSAIKIRQDCPGYHPYEISIGETYGGKSNKKRNNKFVSSSQSFFGASMIKIFSAGSAGSARDKMVLPFISIRHSSADQVRTYAAAGSPASRASMISSIADSVSTLPYHKFSG